VGGGFKGAIAVDGIYNPTFCWESLSGDLSGAVSNRWNRWDAASFVCGQQSARPIRACRRRAGESRGGKSDPMIQVPALDPVDPSDLNEPLRFGERTFAAVADGYFIGDQV
jgi:hypothetical protein